MKKAVLFLAVALAVSVVCNYRQCTNDAPTADTITVERTDTVYYTTVDTMPVVKYEQVTEYVTIPCPGDTADTAVVLPVVQRAFSDDSTYTAYVSGIKYQQWPKLDSILVRQREITNTIRETVTIRETSKAHWNFGVQAGLGVGLLSGRVEPYIGAGVGYSW